MRILWLAAGFALAAAAPASATRFELLAFGTLVASSAPNQTLNGLPFGTGSLVLGSWTVDIAAGTPMAIPSPGTPATGEARLIPGAVSGGVIQIQSSSGDILLQQSSASAGALFALDNVAGAPGTRQDQLTLTDGARATPAGLSFGFTNNSGGFLPPGVFLSALSFGRVASAPLATPPTLLTSLDNLDPFTVWQTGPYIFGLSFRSGAATTQAEFLALPVRSFSVVNLSVFLTPLAAVPEPSSWAMLIAGFGLVGACARRQRRAMA